MPIYDPDHIEYSINSGYVHIVLDNGSRLPAYWAHPVMGRKFPGVAVVHDWWGMTDMVRRLANLFAQMGHYVIAPDLFNGKLPRQAQEAFKMVESLQDNGYPIVHDALGVLEHHHQCNASVGVVGLGLGGSLAFEAAIVRNDLEAAVSYAGFPHRYLGRLKDANTPIYAFYGQQEPYVTYEVIEKLHKELNQSSLRGAHKVQIVEGLAHDFFSQSFTDVQKEQSRAVLKETFAFLDNHLERPQKPPRQVY